MLPCLGLALSIPACDSRSNDVEGRSQPNILWVVWDTVRADRLGPYGHSRDTTPFLDEWSKQARVFENCISAGGSTVPSHGAMFTSKLPSRHGAREGHLWLDDRHQTIAELLGDAGYQTYLWSANPHISSAENFHQGFDREEHPWDPASAQEAYQIVRRKLEGDRSTELTQRFEDRSIGPWAIKAAGELAEKGLQHWLGQRDRRRPFFAFLNYMEAHRPLLPPRRYRERMMSAEDVARSYTIDRSWIPLWSFNFGLHEYSPDELEIMAATYDAVLAELDDLFRSLIESLEARGELENTVIVLTADHGEHLGEHHLLDHQYSLYQDLIRVPLFVYAPQRLEPGRDARAVTNYDIFPTLLELAGVEAPEDLHSSAVSLLDPRPSRPRLSEVPAVFSEPFGVIKDEHPQFDPSPFARRLRALLQGSLKLIWAEDGRHELYDVEADAAETSNLLERDPELAEGMLADLARLARVLDAAWLEPSGEYTPSAEHLEMLRSLGYVAGDGADGDE